MRFATIAVTLFAPLLVSAAPTKYRRAASDNDKTVLKFAEVLEQLETEFYKEALAKFKPEDFTAAGIAVPDIAIQNFQAILSHEAAHTQFLDAALSAVGAEPITGCKFNFDSVLTDVATMASVARVVELVGVGAYLGGSVLVDDKNILVAAASILTIEARHQAFLNVINGASGIPQPFDIPLTPSQVLALAGGFVQECDVQGALGIKSNAPLAITTKGTVTPGTLLTFDLTPFDKAGDGLSCQMLVGGNATLSFPLKDCIVPKGINGPVVILLTTDSQPLTAGVDSPSILAGPAIAFIDSEPDALGAVVRKGTNPVQSSDQITPDQASDALSKASGSISTGASTATDSSSETTAASSSGDATPTPAQDNSSPTPAVAVIGVTSIPA